MDVFVGVRSMEPASEGVAGMIEPLRSPSPLLESGVLTPAVPGNEGVYGGGIVNPRNSITRLVSDLSIT